MHVLECVKLNKTFAGTVVFPELSISIKQGEILSLLGPSGCGKTTLLRCIAGLEQVSAGSILLDGKDITQLKAEARNIVMMFQQPLLFPHLNVLENIVYGLKIRGWSKQAAANKGFYMLEIIDLLEHSKKYPYELSGGQQQRVALARALILEPKLILLDEPFSSLDPELREATRSWVRKILKGKGTAACFVTHAQEEAMLMGDQLAVMMEGRIQQLGSPMEVYRYPDNKLVAEFFSEGIVLNEGEFIPVNKLQILPEGMAAGGSPGKVLEGIVIEKWLKVGKIMCKIVIPQLTSEIVVILNNDLTLNTKVSIYYQQEDIQSLRGTSC